MYTVCVVGHTLLTYVRVLTLVLLSYRDGTDEWLWDTKAAPAETSRQQDSDDDALTRVFFSWRHGPEDVEGTVNGVWSRLQRNAVLLMYALHTEWAVSDVDLVVAGFNYW